MTNIQLITPPRNKSRIEYIDLMKGICITLVVLIHCKISFDNEHIVNMLEHLRMPLYFFLSGLFFKKYFPRFTAQRDFIYAWYSHRKGLHTSFQKE